MKNNVVWIRTLGSYNIKHQSRRTITTGVLLRENSMQICNPIRQLVRVKKLVSRIVTAETLCWISDLSHPVANL